MVLDFYKTGDYYDEILSADGKPCGTSGAGTSRSLGAATTTTSARSAVFSSAEG